MHCQFKFPFLHFTIVHKVSVDLSNDKLSVVGQVLTVLDSRERGRANHVGLGVRAHLLRWEGGREGGMKEGEGEGEGMGKEEGGKKERKVERRERQNNVMKKDGGKEEARKKGGNDREEWRW